MTKTVKQVVAAERVANFRLLLASSGWERVDHDGWLAPDLIRNEVAIIYGRGSLHLWDALRVQCSFDLWVINVAPVSEAA